MKKPRKQSHMIISSIWQGALLCLRCGERYNMAMPIPINLMAATTKAFLKDHRRCKQQPKGAELKKMHDDAWRRYQAVKEAARITA